MSGSGSLDLRGNNVAATDESVKAKSLNLQQKHGLETALRPVLDDLSTLSGKLAAFVPANSRTSKQVIDHVLQSPGKLVRPALYFLICRILGYRGDHYFQIAAVSELVHSASLLHDDVVDNSTVRRQKPSANSIWGDQASVLVGDLVYSRASEMMADTGSLDVVSTFARAIRLMSEGELIQLENCFNPNMHLDDYLKIVEFKTATLLAAACRSAAVLAGASSEIIGAMTTYGTAVGMAFQIKDDALDYLASDEQLGKPTLADLREGKVTLPVLNLLSRCSGVERTTVTTAIERGNPELISELIERHGCVESALHLAGTYTEEALRCLQTLPKNSDRDHLEALTIGLLMRRS